MPTTSFFLFYCSLSLFQASAVMYLRVNFTPVEKWNLLQTVLPSVRSIYMSFTSAVLKPSTVMHMDNFMDWARYLNGQTHTLIVRLRECQAVCSKKTLAFKIFWQGQCIVYIFYSSQHTSSILLNTLLASVHKCSPGAGIDKSCSGAK